MIGIYLITNKKNNKKYIGQSVNIHRRILEHKRSGQPKKYSISNRDENTSIHRAMQKYGIENFSFQILEKCKKEELNDKERYWIHYYNSFEKGYNETLGGQECVGVKGEKHSQAKLTQNEVNNIKILLRTTDKTLDEINLLYPKVSKSTLSMINNGKSWREKDEKYPIRKMIPKAIGERNAGSKFTEKQVREIRKKYSEGIKPKDIIKEYNHIASDAAINAILYGKTYKYLPIWNNKRKEWIEPCIDYPQSLK